ncbi:uncharacterized protein LOC123028202 [Varanus komodoensis]|uniref:uncharacterized protein LOC123028202 n=1 Tax=Varanus komodoensis TaxID=61221 RepID=UPI001CF7A5E9|nr:uncharacterized protein LOC123028202 [Varanus komodoensis]
MPGLGSDEPCLIAWVLSSRQRQPVRQKALREILIRTVGGTRGCRQRHWCAVKTLIFLLSVVPVKIGGAEILGAQPPNFDSPAYSEEDEETDAAPEEFFYEGSDKEESGGIVRRAVRRYPEDSESAEVSHRQVSIPLSRSLECNCPEVLAKGTLVAIVATFAFLGFFSTSVLLLVAVCILRVIDRQRKKGKEAGAKHSASKRPLPPVPPPRPEHTYTTVKPCSGYERLHPVSPTRRERRYQNVKEPRAQRSSKNYFLEKKRLALSYGARHSDLGTEAASCSAAQRQTSPENEYISPKPRQSVSTSPLPHKYANIDELQPEPTPEGSPDPGVTLKGHEIHIYEEVQ